MDNQDWWQAFQKTGRIADYLRYRGIEVFSGTVVNQPKEGDARESDDRRTDHSDEQQYR